MVYLKFNQFIFLEKNFQNANYEREIYSKVINIFMNECKLIERLRQDILLTYRNDLPITISKEIKTQQSLTFFDKNMTLFSWNQLLIYFFVNSPHIDMKQLKKDMIDQCRLEHKDDPTEF
jgi:hypothetical protein